VFDLKSTKIAGCFQLQPKVIEDARGRFVKVFHEQAFAVQGLETNFAKVWHMDSVF
jgi:dTDP-4-dehydrorhamnose 3,5-epimerase